MLIQRSSIEHQTSTPRTPEQNGVVERWNRTLIEVARTMLSASNYPLSFWAEAVAIACYTQNRSIIISAHGKTAYHIINDRKTIIKHLTSWMNFNSSTDKKSRKLSTHHMQDDYKAKVKSFAPVARLKAVRNFVAPTKHTSLFLFYQDGHEKNISNGPRMKGAPRARNDEISQHPDGPKGFTKGTIDPTLCQDKIQTLIMRIIDTRKSTSVGIQFLGDIARKLDD
ncbi:retrovirus-related pol polyprotein from transposon TNT 1-94 [Tanacetum coccineum]|uniref:Retrovirus-related pol polyprotein from transposon TNT 1-94 n=1 Tax=Tanacetum coccineum TaxID=301880 RepID=A0ABQ4ZLF5_9ASTR